MVKPLVEGTLNLSLKAPERPSGRWDWYGLFNNWALFMLEGQVLLNNL